MTSNQIKRYNDYGQSSLNKIQKKLAINTIIILSLLLMLNFAGALIGVQRNYSNHATIPSTSVYKVLKDILTSFVHSRIT